MPSDSNGIYSLPAGYLAVTGETILASQHNPPLEDLEAGMTARLMRSGVAPMTGVLKVVDGAVGAPAVALASAPTWGLYKTSTGWGFSVSGANVGDFTPTALALPNGLTVAKTATLKDGGDTASANALTLGDGNIFNITGTTAITSIGTKGVGTVVWLRFAGVLTFTHHSTDLIVQGGASITTAVGDWATMEEYASGDWRMIAYHRANGSALNAASPRGHIDGCIVSNGTDAANDIDISAGVCRDSTNSQDIILPAIAGKQLDANWAAGAAAGMRNSAAGIADGTYHIYAVAKANGADPDVYAHTSTTVATVLTALQSETGGADYIYARRIRSIVRTSSSIEQETQEGDYIRKKSPSLDISDTNVATGAGGVTFTLVSIPTGLSLGVLLSLSLSGTNAHAIYIRNPSDTDTAASGASAPLATILHTNSIGAGVQARVTTNTSAQVIGRADNANATLKGVPLGYWDTRGRDA